MSRIRGSIETEGRERKAGKRGVRPYASTVGTDAKRRAQGRTSKTERATRVVQKR